MPFPFIDTPRTEPDANATYLRSGGAHGLSVLDSVENSFQSPTRENDLVRIVGNGGTARRREHENGTDAAAFNNNKTPRATAATVRSTRNARHPRNSTTAAPRGEFTPMLNSVMKNNPGVERSVRRRQSLETPMAARGYANGGRIDVSNYHDGSDDNDATPVPQASSSILGTPLSRVAPGNVLGEGQMMTLKEQEKAIDKLDKENFSLKLKIHFLEEHLNKTKPEFNQAARQENVDLKVSNLTMTRDVHKYKKMFRKVEQERDACQLQIEELRDKAKRKYADDELKKELDLVMEELEQKNERIQALEEELNDARDVEAGRIQELTDEVAELQYELREKERALDDKDEVIEAMQQKDESPLVAELEGKLEKMKSQVKDLQESLERAKSAAEDSRTAKREADEKRERAMEDLRQLQDDVANKSITTKGLNRQLEDKAEQLKTQLDDLRRTHSSLQHTLNDESEDKAELERRVREFEKALSAQREKIGSLESERDSAKKERDNASELLRRLEHELDDEGEAKGLLKSRHDAVSAESEQLRHEHERTKEAISELEDLIDSERVQSASQIEDLRSQHRDEVEQLGDEIDVLKHDLEDKLGQHAAEEDRWDAARRTLELAREKAEQQATTLQRTVDRLQSAESSMSGRERRLQDVLDGERQRYHGEQELFSRQIGELNDDIAHRRQTAETQRLELLGVREELRASRRDETALRDRVQALEDEVAVLQATLEEEQERNRGAARAGVDEQLVERQRQQAARDKQAARDQLAAVTRDARVLRAALADVEAERDELRSQLDSLQQAQSTSANPDRCTPRKLDQRREQETLDLRKAKLRLEAELTRLRDELQSGAAVRAQLARELDDEVARAAAEENRLAAELDRRGDALERVTEGRDRELVAARARAERLQQRVTELEAEVHALLVGDGKSGEDDTELELNRQPQRQLEAEVRTIRGQLADARRAVRELRRQTRRQGEQLAQQAASIISANNNNQNQTVSTTGDGIGPEPTSTAVLDQDERRHLHGLLKAATLEAESLSAALAERDARAGELRVRLRRVREDERARLADKMERMAERVARERERAAEAEERIKREREREKERAREKGKEREKGRGAQEEDEEKMRQQVQQQHARELRGLSKEIVWLRARAERERRFREDLAWSKGLMELRERVRVACNEADLRLLADLGASSIRRQSASSPSPSIAPGPRRKHHYSHHSADNGMSRPPSSSASALSSPYLQRLRATAAAVRAMVRMQRMGAAWARARAVADGLGRAKADVLRRRRERESEGGKEGKEGKERKERKKEKMVGYHYDG